MITGCCSYDLFAPAQSSTKKLSRSQEDYATIAILSRAWIGASNLCISTVGSRG